MVGGFRLWVMSSAAIQIKDLRVDYGDFVAVDDVSLEVGAG